MEAQRYQIVVRGLLIPRLDPALGALSVERRAGTTSLMGDFSDHAQLHGVLDRLGDLGLEVVSVRPGRRAASVPARPG